MKAQYKNVHYVFLWQVLKECIKKPFISLSSQMNIKTVSVLLWQSFCAVYAYCRESSAGKLCCAARLVLPGNPESSGCPCDCKRGHAITRISVGNRGHRVYWYRCTYLGFNLVMMHWFTYYYKKNLKVTLDWCCFYGNIR